MTKEVLRKAIDSNRPFTIRMADGKEYSVPHRDFVAFTRKGTSAIVVGEDEMVHFLPLITMTGISLQRDSDNDDGLIA